MPFVQRNPSNSRVKPVRVSHSRSSQCASHRSRLTKTMTGAASNSSNPPINRSSPGARRNRTASNPDSNDHPDRHNESPAAHVMTLRGGQSEHDRRLFDCDQAG